ncbi:hypothetical protein [Oryzifoliimicrobium ureilyticus]|uniref:hypothetical protein n=1 Tax=Oryzifoliimicrobium ureilyticus TaxID=3113724 RepID=UPI003076419F
MTSTDKLIMVAAFTKDSDGKLMPAFDPRQVDTAHRARRDALMLGDRYAGVVAWSREAYPEIGKYGQPVIIYQRGETPDIERLSLGDYSSTSKPLMD